VAELKGQVALFESEVERLQDRVAWAERMVKKGYMTNQQLRAEQAALQLAEMALTRARQDLANLLPHLPHPKSPAEKEPKPPK
jgi:outer membrane protein TolC